MRSASRIDNATREISQFQIRLRPDLIVVPVRSAAETWYQIESPVTGRFFRVGQTEYTFMSLMDGRTTLAEAISLTSRRLGARALDERQAEALITWLMANQLTEASQTEAFNAAEIVRRHEDRRVREWLNPFWLKIPLTNPDRWIEASLPWLGWIFSMPAICLALVLWLLAISQIATEWSRFSDPFQTVFHRSNWLCLSLIWIGLKGIHELSHAVVCRRHGGPVREMGLILILFAPVAYVDVTNSLRFRSKWQRIMTAAAGMYAELTLAAVAVLAWAHTESAELSYWLLNVIWMAGLTTLIFNANPLMKLDGYHMLADWLEIQNLSVRGQQAVRELARSWLLGRSHRHPADLGKTRWIVLGYGLSAVMWNLLMGCGMLIVASALWQGTGVVLVAGVLLIWAGRSIIGGIVAIRELSISAPATLLRTITLVSFGGGALALVLWLAPWPASRTAPGFIEYRDLASVRAKTPGFVVAIHVVNGQLVEQGQLLLQLENRELESEVHELEFGIRQSQLRQQQYLQADRHGDLQVEEEQSASLEKRLAEKQERLDAVMVRSPIAGRVMARDLDSRIGTYAVEGGELLVVGQESEKEFRASLSQEDANLLERGATLRIRLHQFGNVQGAARLITPRASRVPPHPALAVSGGGPLTVRLANHSEKSTDQPQKDEQFELTDPRVTVAFTLADTSTMQDWPTGTTGFVALQQHLYRSLGEGLWQSAKKYLREKIDDAWNEKSPLH